jgi:hypothetical protein
VDFIPIVQSGSLTNLTTYKTPIQSLNDYMKASGSALSALYASQSLSASHAVLSDSASYLYPTILYNATVTSSVSSSWSAIAFTSSWAATSSVSFTSSYARLSDSASYLYPTILYNATVTASVSASWARFAPTASWAANGLTTASFYPISTSFSNTSSYTLGSTVPVGAVVAWTPTVLNVTPAPSGWLYADGKIFSDVSFPALASLIGHNYGRPITTSVEIKAESTNAYHNAHNGYLKVRFVGGGSGNYALTSGSTTFFASNGGSIVFTTCNSGIFPATIFDLSVSPVTTYAQSYTIPYGPTGTRTTSSVILGTQQFRVPNFVGGYYSTNTSPIINPISYIIKT